MAKKKICKLAEKDCHNEKPQKFRKLVELANYICKKCGRTAKDKDSLCKPEKF